MKTTDEIENNNELTNAEKPDGLTMNYNGSNNISSFTINNVNENQLVNNKGKEASNFFLKFHSDNNKVKVKNLIKNTEI